MTCSEHVSEFKFLGCVLDKSECSRKKASGRRVAGAIRSLVNARSLQLECARVMFLCMVVRQLYEGRRGRLGLGLYRLKP